MTTDPKPAVADLADGLYFGLPEDQYHALPRGSYSLLKNLRVDPLDAYLSASWLGGDGDASPDTRARIVGRAYHAMILEGPDVLEERLSVLPRPDDYPEHLAGGEQLRAACKALGVSAGGTLREMAGRIRDADPSALLFEDVLAEHTRTLSGRTELEQAEYVSLHRTAAIIRNMPRLRERFAGGASEVSILWTDRRTGVRMKARLDKLRMDGDAACIEDLKSFAMKGRNAPVAVAARREITNNVYWLQPPVYLDGLAAAQAMLADKGFGCVHMMDGGDPPEWLEDLAMAEDRRFTFVFARKDVPNVVPVEWCQHDLRARAGASVNTYWLTAYQEYRDLLDLFSRLLRQYGTDRPWVVEHETMRLRDGEFRLWDVAPAAAGDTCDDDGGDDTDDMEAAA